jgi:hypothetical protein
MNCAYRTGIGTSATINADILVNFVEVAGRDCLYGTFVNASTASSTFIFSNFVSHYKLIYKLKILQIYIIFLKNTKSDGKKA